jgi:acetyl esterase/lipase
MSEAVALSSVEIVINRMQALYGRWNRHTTLEQMRRDFDEAFQPSVSAGKFDPVTAGGVLGAWITPDAARIDKVVLYLHGGGFRLGSIRSHRSLIARIAAACGCRVLAIDYRLAPEHRFPAALEDAQAAFLWLREQGFAASDIAIAGDSAGGGLALGCMLALRDQDLGVPCAAALLSPWTDLTASGASYTSRAARDPVHTRAMILALASNYLGDGVDPRHPLASPLFADLRGLPPLLIQAGDRETVLDDARALADKATAAGLDTRLEVYDEMIHVFQMYASDIIEAGQAITSIGDFLRLHLNIK